MSRDYMRPRRARNLDQPLMFRAAVNGWEPAEILTPHDRRVLITDYVAQGHTDRQIAARTAWTDYTVARLRDELELTANVRSAA